MLHLLLHGGMGKPSCVNLSEVGGTVLAGIELDGVAADPANECGRNAY